MADEITPQAKPISPGGEAEWFPPAEDDSTLLQPEQPKGLRWIFIGRDGLRAGWSLLLWLAFVSMLGRGVNVVLHLLLHGSAGPQKTAPPEWFQMSVSAAGFFVTAAAALLVSKIEKRRWTSYGIGRIHIPDFAMGLFWGFALLSVLVAALWKGGFLVFGGLRLHGSAILIWALLFALSFLFTGLFEEFAFRGFPQFTLTRGIAGLLRSCGIEDHAASIAFWITAVLLAIMFGAAHAGNPGEGRIGVYAAGIIGLLFAFSLWRTGSLWWAIGFHAAWDWAESFFYGTADSGGVSPHRLLTSTPQGNPFYSGGTVGPEGSIFVLGILVLLVLVIALTLKPRAGSASMNTTR